MKTSFKLRNRFGLLAAVLGMALVVAGCGSSNDGATGGGGSTGNDRLVVATAATPTTLDPEFASSPQDREVDISVYDRFVKLADDGSGSADLAATPEPKMAESWKQSKDGTTFTFKLRKGVKSFQGNELTSEDVIWSWDRVFAQQSHGLFALGVSSVEKDSYRAVDKYTVEVKLDKPNPLLPVVLATPIPGAVIYDSTEVKKHTTPDDKWGANWLAKNTASFGPYHAKEFIPGQQVVLEANPNYYGDPVALKEVIMREIPDPANRLALLRSGEADIAQDLNAELRRSLGDQAGVKVQSQPGNLAIAYGLNNEMAPFDDPKVREAVALALPVDDIIETVYFNDPTARLFKGYVADNFPGYPDYWPHQPQDVAKAKKLVEDAGATGEKVEISYATTYPEHEKIAQFIASALKEIGLNPVPTKMTPAKYEEQYWTLSTPMTT
ncbi:MAG: ABC transporter substrate-binding protein, partial [Actinomycetota bacterium]|nr:ABC transporter substrate-binding protein [Actinomycetota bacterium]